MIRPARPDDVAVILDFIRGLARYEKLEHELDLDAARLSEHLFGVRPVCGAFIAEQEGRAVGFALWCTSYSTFKTRDFVHLEDLFVLPEHRGNGHGLALLRAVAGEAVRQRAPRLQWCVLDWNVDAIAFYEQQGAELLHDWRLCRVSGHALSALAQPAE